MEPHTRHLGSGWSFPIALDPHGRVRVSSAEERVEQSIRIILSTSKGERVMRPDFGCAIHDFVFSTIDSTNLMMIESSVREALERWEPRIDVLDVEARADSQAEGRLLIELQYRIRSTNFERNLVYPFYLSTGS